MQKIIEYYQLYQDHPTLQVSKINVNVINMIILRTAMVSRYKYLLATILISD